MKIGEADNRFEPTPRRFVRTALARGNAVAWRSFDGKAWNSHSWTGYLNDVRKAARALVALGVVKGDVVCILGYNRPELPGVTPIRAARTTVLRFIPDRGRMASHGHRTTAI